MPESSKTSSPFFVHSKLDEFGLSPVQFRVLGHIARCGDCWASLDKIARFCRMKRLTVIHALQFLVQHRIVFKEARVGHTSVYMLNTNMADWLPVEDVEESKKQPSNGDVTEPKRQSNASVTGDASTMPAICGQMPDTSRGVVPNGHQGVVPNGYRVGGALQAPGGGPKGAPQNYSPEVSLFEGAPHKVLSERSRAVCEGDVLETKRLVVSVSPGFSGKPDEFFAKVLTAEGSSDDSDFIQGRKSYIKALAARELSKQAKP